MLTHLWVLRVERSRQTTSSLVAFPFNSRSRPVGAGSELSLQGPKKVLGLVRQGLEVWEAQPGVVHQETGNGHRSHPRIVLRLPLGLSSRIHVFGLQGYVTEWWFAKTLATEKVF